MSPGENRIKLEQFELNHNQSFILLNTVNQSINQEVNKQINKQINGCVGINKTSETVALQTNKSTAMIEVKISLQLKCHKVFRNTLKNKGT